MSQFHVNQIATHVQNKYGEENWNDGLDEVNNWSRLLALFSVDLILGEEQDEAQRLIEITDGAGDRGIDAVGIDRARKLIVLVQSKWRQDGSGSLTLAETLKFVDGVRSLLGMKGDAEPVHATAETREAMNDLLITPGARILLVTATTGSEDLAEAVDAPIVALLAQVNDLQGSEPLATHRHFTQGDFFDSLTEAPIAAVSLEVQLQDWGSEAEPLKIYYGRVGAADIAGWYAAHRDDLFAENIRVVIPRSDINEGMLETIQSEPERFGYYNNGITILADSIEVGPGGAINKEVGFFRLDHASIVNGAQTVSTLGKVLGTEHELNLGRAFVMVRCIEVPAAEEDLASRITRFANTQNIVSIQDFAFLDPEQHRLAKDLRAMGYEYLIRTGESPRSEDPAKVIEVRQAAIALACAHPDIGHAVTAKREVSRLFAPEGNVYPILFNGATDPVRLLRAVLTIRRVDQILDEVERNSEGVEAGVAVHGRRVIGHLVLRSLGDDALTDPAFDFDAALAAIEHNVLHFLNALVVNFPENSYPGNVFKSQPRSVELFKDAGLE